MTTLTSDRPLSKPRHRRLTPAVADCPGELDVRVDHWREVECGWFPNREQSFCMRDVVVLRPAPEGYIPLCLKHHEHANEEPAVLANRRGHRINRIGAHEHRHAAPGDERIPGDARDAR